MPRSAEQENRGHAHRRYTWPWFVLAGVLAAIALAVLWLSFEIRRTQRIRDLNTPGTQQHL